MLDETLSFHLWINSHFKQNSFPLKVLFHRHTATSLRDAFRMVMARRVQRAPAGVAGRPSSPRHASVSPSCVSALDACVRSAPSLRSAVLHQSWPCRPHGDMWQCPEARGSSPVGEGGVPGIWWVESREAAKCPMGNRTVTQNKRLSSPKCLCAQGEKSSLDGGDVPARQPYLTRHSVSR